MFSNKANSPLIYIPPDAKINIGNEDMDVPITKYDKRQQVFDQIELEKLTKLKGKDNDRNNQYFPNCSE